MKEFKDNMPGNQLRISGSLIASNTLFSLIGQAVPLLVGVLTIPFVVHGLGVDRFGLLSLAWVVLGYFAVFDLGLGKATVKYVSEAIGKGEDGQIHQIIWTAVIFQAVLGFVGAILLFGVTDLLVERVLNIPPQLLDEAKDTFHLMALSIPLILVSSSFSGTLEAFQRFDLENAVIIPSSTLTFILPVVGLYMGFGLPGIVALILLVRFATLITFVIMVVQIIPQVKELSFSFSLFFRLFSFGGWVMISNFIIPIFIYLDRILIGALLTMSAVTYYTVPYEIAIKLLIIPGSVAVVLFPAFSSIASVDDKYKIEIIVTRTVKYIITFMIPIIIIFLMFSEDILRIWLGNEFAEESTLVFQLLLIGIFLNAIGYVPFALIQGIGRPDVIAKYHIVELPFYVFIVFVLVNLFGINGAALAWCFRMIWTIPIFFLLCIRVAQIPLRAFSNNGTNRSLMVAAGILMSGIVLLLKGNWGIGATGLLSGVLVIGSILLSWFISFDSFDRDFIKRLFLQARTRELIQR